jgi:hypothetical protein
MRISDSLRGMLRAAGGATALATLLAQPLDAQAPRRQATAALSRGGEILIALPQTVRGGDTVPGSVTLPSNAPAGGVRITLTTSHANVTTVESAVTVPAFQRAASFNVAAAARRGEPGQTVTISARAAGVSPARGSRSILVTQAAAARTAVVAPAAAPPAATLSDAGQASIQSRLEPAPPVSDWRPRSQAQQGTTIVITGSGFRPADVAVRIGTRKLVLVEATSTRLVARAPGANDPGVLDPYITGPLSVSHAASQASVLERGYRIVDRWEGYAPRAARVAQRGALTFHDAVTTKQWVAIFEIDLEGLPGEEIVGHASAPTDGSCGQQLWTVSRAPLTEGRASLEVRMIFRIDAMRCERLKLPLRLRYTDAPDDVRTVVLDLGAVNLRTVIRVERTQELIDAGILVFTDGSGSGTCTGQVDGIAVGRLTIEGDAAFRLHDALTGARCKWTLTQSTEPGGWLLREDGWTIHELGWKPSQFPQGQRCGPVRKSGGSELGMFTFDRGEVYMGWDARRMAPDSAMHVLLACMAAAQAPFVIGLDPNAPHYVTAQLDWVELRTPAGAVRWQELVE